MTNLDTIEKRIDQVEAQNQQLKAMQARKDRVSDYIEIDHKNTPAHIYCMHLLEGIRDRYQDNTAIWKQVIRSLGSAYERAHKNFQTTMLIQEQEKKARQQMIQYVLGTVAGAGLCWVSAAAQAWNLLSVKGKVATAFFSGGIQEVVKKGAIYITKDLAEVMYPENPLSLRNLDLLGPQEFQNNLMNAFEHCTNQVTRQFNQLIDQIKDIGEKRFLKNPKQYAYNINDTRLSEPELFKRIDGPYNVARQFCLDITTELIDTAVYFREKPNSMIYDEKKSGGITNTFTDFMAKRFERVLWAGWIPNALEYRKSHDYPPGAQPPANTIWMGKYGRAELKEVSPGYYRDIGTSRTILVSKAYEDPEKSVVKRLTQLGVFLSANATGAQSKGTNKIRGFGMVCSEADVQRLIAWARREPASKIEGQTGFDIVRRPAHELYISGLR